MATRVIMSAFVFNSFFSLYCDLTRHFIIIIITPKHMSVGCTTRVYEVGADEMAVKKGWKKR